MIIIDDMHFEGILLVPFTPVFVTARYFIRENSSNRCNCDVLFYILHQAPILV